MIHCVDASVVLRVLLQEPGWEAAKEWFALHVNDELIAPHFMPTEVLSTLRRKCRSGQLTSEQAKDALRFLAELGLRLVWSWALAERALALAEELDQPTVYDSLYLAVAEEARCEFWTADERFVRCAASRYPFVRLLNLG